MSVKHAFVRSSLVLALAGCAGNPLEADPPPGSEVVDLGDTLRTEVAGVELSATVDEWPGDSGVYDHVTPVRLDFVNTSGHPLRVNYENMKIVEADGRSYHVLPFYRMEGAVTKPVVVSDWSYTVTYPAGFAVPAYAAPLYPADVVVYEGPYDYSPEYYDNYYRYWADLSLPTPEMVDRSLPEGVLSDGAAIDGWVYFERISDDPKRGPVFLTVELVDAETGAQLGRAELPFMVK